MDEPREVDVVTMLGSIAQMVEQNQEDLDKVDSAGGTGTHGARMAAAFRTAAEAARRTRTNDAGEQLAAAAEAMRAQGQGRATQYYADGLEDAAQQFRGKSAISLDNLAPFLQAFLGGVQRRNPAQPGQGTMLDALLPAVGALTGQQNDPKRGALEALIESVTGARNTAQQRGGRVDPGAASATSVLGGIVSALLPGIMGMVMGKLGQRQAPQPEYDAPAQRLPSEPQDQGRDLGDILGDVMGGRKSQPGRDTGYGQPAETDSPLGGLGDLLGKLGGLGSSKGSDRQSGGGWWPF